MYNNHQTNSIAENTPRGNFVRYAKRYSKNWILLRQSWSFSFWRHVVDSDFLQKDRSQKTSPGSYPPSTKEQRLPSFRTYLGSAVLCHHGPQTHQQDRDFAIQRSFSADVGTAEVPGSVDPEAIPRAIVATGHSSDRPFARQLARSTFLVTAQTPQPDLRYRFHRCCPLRQTGECPDRIQPQEARSPFLSPNRLFRVTLSRILARFLETRQRGLVNWHHRIPQGLPCQGPLRHCHEQGTLSHGLRILQPACCRFPRRSWLWLRHRCQRISNRQDPGPRLSFSSAPKRLGSRRIPCAHSSELCRSSPFRGCSQTNSRRSTRSQTAPTFSGQKVRLPHLRDKSHNDPLARVSFLQSSGCYRKEQPRTSLRLPARENPFSLLDIQRCIFPADPFVGQYCPLVQTPVPATGILDCHTRYHSHRFSAFTNTDRSQSQSKYCQSSPGLSVPKRIHVSFYAGLPFEVARKISFLQTASPVASSRRVEK